MVAVSRPSPFSPKQFRRDRCRSETQQTESWCMSKQLILDEIRPTSTPADMPLVSTGAVHLSSLDAAESIHLPSKRYRSPLGERRLLLIVGDLFAAMVATWVAFVLWHVLAKQTLQIDPVTFISKMYWFPAIVGVWVSLAWLYDMYDPATTGNSRTTIQQLILITLSAFALGCLTYFILPDYSPRTFILLFLPTMCVLVGLWRVGLAVVSRSFDASHRVLVIGDPFVVTELSSVMSRSVQQPFRLVAWATVPDLARLYFEVEQFRLSDYAHKVGIEEIIVSSHVEKLDDDVLRALIQCQASGVRVSSMPDVYRRLSRQIPVEYVDYDWVLNSLLDRPMFSRVQLAAKRVIDLAGALLAVPVTLAVIPLAAVAVKLDSRGPVFYSQCRSGRGGRPFNIIKIRTMRTDAESDGVARWAGDNDPRITRVGRILRKTRIDELPQIWNVLRGDMSLVGPRPERPEIEARLERELPHFSVRHLVKPGVTGWAQIHYKYGNCREDSLRKLQYDFYYIRYWSLLLDLYVILRTIGVVVGFKGT